MKDTELQQIEMALRAIDELEERLFKIRTRIGDGAYKRALRYLKDRRAYVFQKVWEA